MQPLEDDLHIELGYCYADARGHENPRQSKGRPGTRTSRISSFEPDGRQISTLDLFGRNFVMLAGPQWRETAISPGCEIQRIDAPEVLDAYGIGPDSAVLVRPDGFVASRFTSQPECQAE